MSAGLNPVCINFQTRPRLNKLKAENVAKEGWNLSSTFHEGFLRNKEVFVEQAEQQKSSNVINQLKERNGNLSNIFSRKNYHSLKRKSVSQISNVHNEFLPSDEESVACNFLSFNDTIISNKRLKNNLLKRKLFSAACPQIKKASLQQIPQQHIDDNLLGNGLGKQKERNAEHLSKDLLGKICHSIKRKSVSEIPKITNDFVLGPKESVVSPILSFNDTINSHKQLKNDVSKRKNCTSTSLQIKKASLQQVPKQHIVDSLNTLQNVFEVKSKTQENVKENKLLCEKVSSQQIAQQHIIGDTLTTFQKNFEMISKTFDNVKENKLSHDASYVKSFVSDNNSNKMSLILSSKCNSAKKDILLSDQESNDKTLSKLTLEQLPKTSDFYYMDSSISMRAPFKISNHKIVPCEGTSNYGSNWVQSLNWSVEEEESYHCEKKRIPKITPGGYAAHLLKLQRKELSERHIYEHKMGTNKIIESLRMFILSVSYLDELILTKCSMISEGEEKLEFGIKESSLIKGNSENECGLCEKSIYFVILQKKFFCKYQLKPGNCFMLLKPWHFLQVNSLPYPVIFCTHFKCTGYDSNLNEKCETSMNYESRECISTTNKYLNNNFNWKNIFNEEEDLFYLKWKKNINIVGRIQRIWKTSSNKSHDDFSKIKSNYRLSILLHSKQNIFFMLVIPLYFCDISNDCLVNICNAEGRCYIFYNLRVAQRLQILRNPKLTRYLQNLLKLNTESKLNQEFLYQLVIEDFSELSCKETFASPDFPVYLQPCIKPLSSLRKSHSSFEKFSCFAKILLQYKNYLYINDTSLSFSDSVQYVRVVLTKEDTLVISSAINIKDAVIHEGYLILDEYSQISLLPENQNKLKTDDLKNLNIPLHFNSKVADIASVSGVITDINENEACSWLQCNFCKSENLIQDAEGIIYCEDCSLAVANPVLHLKMSVTIHNKEQPNVLLHIQLSSGTIKNILCLEENSVHPQCNVSDVLGKTFGPFICFIRGVEMIESKRVFYLDEINTSELLMKT